MPFLVYEDNEYDSPTNLGIFDTFNEAIMCINDMNPITYGKYVIEDWVGRKLLKTGIVAYNNNGYRYWEYFVGNIKTDERSYYREVYKKVPTLLSFLALENEIMHD